MEEADGRFNLRETQARVSVPVRRVLCALVFIVKVGCIRALTYAKGWRIVATVHKAT
jgi:hypothetical protein